MRKNPESKYWDSVGFSYPSIILKYLHQRCHLGSQASSRSRSTESNVKNSPGKEKKRATVE
jgi:hypothetical protein